MFNNEFYARTQEHDAFFDYERAVELPKKLNGATLVHYAQLLDLKYYLPSDMLAKVDRMSMRHGLEVRVPFLDLDLARFCIGLPQEMKTSLWGGKKLILRKVLRGVLPDSTVKRKKTGFNFPFETYIRQKGAQWIVSLFDQYESEAQAYLNRDGVHRLLNEHCERKQDHRYVLFSILMFLLWIKNTKSWQQL